MLTIEKEIVKVAPRNKKPEMGINNLLTQNLKKVNKMSEQTEVLTPEQKAAQKEAAAIAKKEKADALKAEKAQKAAEKKAAKEEADKIAKAEKEAAKAETPEVVRVEQNGVKQPLPDTKAGDIWRIANEISAQNQRPVSLKELTNATTAQGHSASTVFSEYSRWRKFYGITGRIEDPEQAAKKAQKAAEDAAKKAAKEAQKASRVEQNGVKRPFSGTKCGAIWDLADSMSAAKGSPVSSAELLAEGDKLGMNRNNVSGEYSMWRKFHGISGRIINPANAGKAVEKLQSELAKAVEKLAKAQSAVDKLNAEIVKITPAQTQTTEIAPKSDEAV